MEEKNNKLGNHQNLNFLCIKNMIKEVTRQTTECEKVFDNYIFDKGFVTRIYKELLQSNNKKHK